MRDDSTKLPAWEQANEVVTLRIWHCKYKSLQAIAELENLQELVIAGYPDQTLEPVAGLRSLRYLSILDIRNVTSLEALSSLQQLESLSLATPPSWDSAGKRTIVDTLEPVSRLKALKHLELFGVCPPDRKLNELLACEQLSSARFSGYPKKEVEDYYAKSGVENAYLPNNSFE
jgi:hypothetical protein